MDKADKLLMDAGIKDADGPCRCSLFLFVYSPTEDGKTWSCDKFCTRQVFTLRQIKAMKTPPVPVCEFILNPIVEYVVARKNCKSILEAIKNR